MPQIALDGLGSDLIIFNLEFWSKESKKLFQLVQQLLFWPKKAGTNKAKQHWGNSYAWRELKLIHFQYK
jgi:hypothetical protein